MVEFSFVSNKKILFGCGKTAELIPLLTDIGGEILFLTGQSIKGTGLFEKLRVRLNEERIPVDYRTVSGEPSPETVDDLTESCRSKTIKGVVALGGGSVIDAGKAVAAMLCEEGSIQDYLEGVGTKSPSGRKVPFYALPTTAGTGSECTKNAVISRPGPEGFKKSLRHDNYVPDIAIIDPDWTESLPVRVGASCGMDAFSQLLESYLSTQASPLTDCLAETGLKCFFRSFSAIIEGEGKQRKPGGYLPGRRPFRPDPCQCGIWNRPRNSRRTGRPSSHSPRFSLWNPYASHNETDPVQSDRTQFLPPFPAKSG